MSTRSCAGLSRDSRPDSDSRDPAEVPAKVYLNSATLAHAPIPGAYLPNGLGVPDETQTVTLSEYRVAPRDDDSEAAMYQRDQAPVWQVYLTQRTADEDG